VAGAGYALSASLCYDMMIAFVHDMPSGLAVGGAAIYPCERQGSVGKHNLISPECNISQIDICIGSPLILAVPVSCGAKRPWLPETHEAVDIVLLSANFLFFVKDFRKTNLQVIGIQYVTIILHEAPTTCFQH